MIEQPLRTRCDSLYVGNLLEYPLFYVYSISGDVDSAFVCDCKLNQASPSIAVLMHFVPVEAGSHRTEVLVQMSDLEALPQGRCVQTRFLGERFIPLFSVQEKDSDSSYDSKLIPG